MDVLGIGEIGNERQDQAQGQPPADVLRGRERRRAPPGPEPTDAACERPPPVRAVLCRVEALAQEPRPDMQEDERADNRRVPSDAEAGFGMYERLPADLQFGR